jgi:hypothetical protein
MIEFKKVRCKNFLSYGNYWTEIDFSALGGTTLITERTPVKSTLYLIPRYVFCNRRSLINQDLLIVSRLIAS